MFSPKPFDLVDCQPCNSARVRPVGVLPTGSLTRREGPADRGQRNPAARINNEIARHSSKGTEPCLGKRVAGYLHYMGADPTAYAAAMAHPVLLLHGLAGSTATTWASNGWLDLLSEGGRTPVGVDMLGHGTAAKSHDSNDYEHLEEEALGRAPEGMLDAIGFSMGARTLLYLAATHPDRFEKIIVSGVGANLFDRNPDRHRAIAEGIGGTPNEDDPVAQYFAGLARQPGVDADALRALLGRSSPPLTSEMIASIEIPVLVVLGDNDFAGPAAPLLEALPNATHVELKRTDHFATPKNFDFIDAALDFLDAQPY